jgi:hypothetical protein
VSHVPERLLPALSVVIDAPSHKPPHFRVSEDHVVRFIDGRTELLARPLDQLDKVSVLELHAAPSPIGGEIHKRNVSFRPIADIRCVDKLSSSCAPLYF